MQKMLFASIECLISPQKNPNFVYSKSNFALKLMTTAYCLAYFLSFLLKFLELVNLWMFGNPLILFLVAVPHF